jgi:exodeoxyribonuclease VII small subunit
MAKKAFDFEKVQSIADLKEAEVSFESAYSKIENIVEMQEKGTLNLEDSIKFYKIGKILTQYCQEILNEAKEDIEKISNE